MLVFLVLATLLSSCGEEPAGAAGTWLRCEGPDGVTIALDAAPRRIVAATVGVTEILAELIDRDRVAAVPEHFFQGWAAEGAGRWPEASAAWKSDHVLAKYAGEDLLAFSPDLVISESYQDADATRRIRELGVPVLSLPEITSFPDLVRNIEIIGRCVGASDRAATLIRDLERRHAALLADTSRKDVRVLSYSNYGTGGWTAGSGCAADLMIRLAGMKNAGAEDGRARHWQIEAERLATLDPEILLVGKDAQNRTPAATILEDHAVLSKMSAVREGKIVALPAALWNTTSHRLLDAAEQLAAAVDAVR